MLVSIAIGDAYGAAFEYANEMQQYNDLRRYYQHPRHNVYPGQYTDDTQMSLAIAEMIINDKPMTKSCVADSFVYCFKRDPRDGYARSFQKFLESVKTGSEFLERINPTSDKSGAAMRAMPLGVLTNIQDVLNASTIQARVTHDTAHGIAAAQASALATHYIVYDLGPKIAIGKFLDAYIPNYQWNEDWKGKVKSKGWMAVKAAITAIKRNNTQSGLLKDCIAFTGDTDTVAAIAMGIASKSKYYDNDVSCNENHPLLAGLENGKYGLHYLRHCSDLLNGLFEQ